MNKELDLAILKRKLRDKKRKKLGLWENLWWIFWFLLPIIGWIILLIIFIDKLNRTIQLENDCEELKEQIQDLENELWKEKQV